ncbi:MAG TPA: hypothetical protein VD996_07600 [Chitinophagaceae bacterium]|nr:hypothetical protein [Chitinophagaceae bacterium]
MITEQINLVLTELLKMNFGLADLSSFLSFKNNSNDRVYSYEYSFDDSVANKKLRNMVSTAISNQAIQNDCVVFLQNNSIRIEKRIDS